MCLGLMRVRLTSIAGLLKGLHSARWPGGQDLGTAMAHPTNASRVGSVGLCAGDYYLMGVHYYHRIGGPCDLAFLEHG